VFLSLRNESSSSFDFRHARIVFQTDREDDAPLVPVTTAATNASSHPPPPLYSYARPTNPVAALLNIIIRPTTPRRAVVVVCDLCARPIIIITITIITVRRVNYCLGDALRSVAFPRAFFLRRLKGGGLGTLNVFFYFLAHPS